MSKATEKLEQRDPTSTDVINELVATINYIAEANVVLGHRVAQLEQLLQTTQYFEYLKELRDSGPRIQTID